MIVIVAQMNGIRKVASHFEALRQHAEELDHRSHPQCARIYNYTSSSPVFALYLADIPILDKVRTMIRSTDQTGHAGCCQALKTLAFGSRLKEISIPTLIIGGANDKGAPPAALAAAAAEIPGAKHVIVPAAGHISNLENPTEFNKELKNFLSGI